MLSLEYLYAVYYLASRYHSGQWSKGYRLLCLVNDRINKHHCGLDIGRQMENLQHRKTKKIYSKEFCSRVAYFVRKLRKYRHSF